MLASLIDARSRGLEPERGRGCIQSRQQQEVLWRLYGRLARRPGRPAEEIAEDTRRGRYLDAREALDYGLIDEITAR